MLIIKVGATDSTNLHLKRTMAETELQDFTVLTADEQHKGRGQAGRQWISEPGKNLTFSVLKYFEKQEASQGFLISKAVSLALVEAFRGLGIPGLSVKWPNDIMSGSKKICGILIENTLKGSRLAHSVIGIGINVNQSDFQGLPHASSLSLTTGIVYDLDSVLDLVLQSLEKNLVNIDRHQARKIHEVYDHMLFARDKKADFRIGGEVVSGIIRGVSREGKLILDRDGQRETYALKEIAFLL